MEGADVRAPQGGEDMFEVMTEEDMFGVVDAGVAASQGGSGGPAAGDSRGGGANGSGGPEVVPGNEVTDLVESGDRGLPAVGEGREDRERETAESEGEEGTREDTGVGPEEEGGEGDGEDGGRVWESGWEDGGEELGDEYLDERTALLRRLVLDFSVRTLAEKTGVDQEVWVQCHMGVRELDDELFGQLLVVEAGRPDRDLREEEGDEWEEEGYGDGRGYEFDTDGDGKVDLVVPDVGRMVKGEKRSEGDERMRRVLWSARSVALLTQFRLGMTVEEQVAAVGFLTQVELVLIMKYDESVPDPGADWSLEKRSREIDRRLARLRWVEEKQREDFGGWKGIWRALVGRKRVTGKELFEKMLDEADDMMLAMSGIGQGDEVVDEMMKLTGVGYLREAARVE